MKQALAASLFVVTNLPQPPKKRQLGSAPIRSYLPTTLAFIKTTNPTALQRRAFLTWSASLV
jgi:hypothetical protein